MLSELNGITTNPLHPPILDIHHSLCMCIAEVTLVGQPEMDLGLVQGVCDLVWEDASRQTRHDFLGLLEMCGVEDVIVDDEVVAEECGLDRNEWSSSQIKSAKRSNGRALYFMFLNRPPTVCITISMITLVRSLRCVIT